MRSWSRSSSPSARTSAGNSRGSTSARPDTARASARAGTTACPFADPRPTETRLKAEGAIGRWTVGCPRSGARGEGTSGELQGLQHASQPRHTGVSPLRARPASGAVLRSVVALPADRRSGGFAFAAVAVELHVELGVRERRTRRRARGRGRTSARGCDGDGRRRIPAHRNASADIRQPVGRVRSEAPGCQVGGSQSARSRFAQGRAAAKWPGSTRGARGPAGIRSGRRRRGQPECRTGGGCRTAPPHDRRATRPARTRAAGTR